MTQGNLAQANQFTSAAVRRRGTVLNDLVDQIGFPVTQFINNPENSVYLAQRNTADLDELLNYVDTNTVDTMLKNPDVLIRLRWKLNLQSLFSRSEWVWVDELLQVNKDHPDLIET